MKETKTLEVHIVELYRELGNQKLRWKQIRNELLTNEEIPLEKRKSESFGVYVSRSLSRLCRDGTLQKHEDGHRNVGYSLTKNAETELHGTGRIKAITTGAS